ncbi:glutathione S-transferase Mu 1-like isoform X2 [Leptotrombidium deliense]|uniref:Glutathione S-transferase n=1 Tax=Leptotrombidium deliense TaxID=299467 RepID=A0A443SD83_9ACAR|nr:glutathione S-transferase Mu 1-like isoform X2 [Leptotrombidium deliense]
MSKLVLGYWDLRGLTEPIRYLLHYADVDFEDKRYTVGPAPEFDTSEWTNEKNTLGLDFPNLPYIIEGDLKLSQSTAILRYLARKYKLVGETEEETIRLDLAEQQLVDVRTGLVKVAYSGSEYEKNREEYLKTLPEKLELLSKFLGDRKFILGDKLTYVDFLLYEVLDFHRLFEATSLNAYENLKSYLERFEALPAIEKYMKSGKFSRLPVFGPMASFGGKKE